jgi:gluconokinase
VHAPVTAGPPREVVIGLDVGTSGVKAAAFGLRSRWSSVALREYPLLEPEPGQEVQDPTRILQACGEALAECAGAAGGSEVVAVSVSAAMHGLLALGADRRPLTPLVTWADSRAREESRALRRAGDGVAARLQALTGAPVHPMTPLTKLLWFARHDPTTWAAARWWIGLKEWALLWLTGELVTELSSASGTGLLDMATRSWSPVALALCRLDSDRLAPILPTTATLALAAGTAHRVGLPAGTVVAVGAADGPLGNLGSGAIAEGVAGLSLGTSGAVRMAVGRPQVDRGGALFCYALTDSLWVIGGAISNGAGVLRWVGRSLTPDLQSAVGGWAAAVRVRGATAPPGSEGLLMLPYLLAERAPLWDPDLPGAYLGLRREHTRAHLARAAMEGVCLQMRLVLDRLDEVTPVSVVTVTGGAFRSPLWRQLMAAVLARPIRVVGDAEGTARGAAALSLLALGRAPSPGDAVAEIAADEPPPEVVEPDPKLVSTYRTLADSAPGLIRALGPVAELFVPRSASGGGTS